MKARAYTARLPRDTDLATLRHRLSALGEATLHSPMRACRQWLDSFDWRLHRSGQRLERWGGSADTRLRFSEIDDPRRVIELPCGQAPAFATDIASAVLRRRIAQSVGVRRLLPQCEMHATLQLLSVCDERQKLVVRIEVWRPLRRGELFVRVTPIRGYETVSKRAFKHLLACVDASAEAIDPLQTLAEQLPIAPGQYPRWVVRRGARPGADTRTDVVVRRQLAHYADIMALNIDAMRQGLDSEFLHQFRVGLARSRALLRNGSEIFAAGRIRPHTEFLKWLASETGTVRDAQVHALVFPGYVATLSANERQALTPLLELVNSEQQRAQDALAAMVASARFRRRWQAWLRFVRADAPRTSRQVLGAQPVAATAPQLLARRARRVKRKGRKIDGKSPPEAYHELRKECKRLRYNIDLYGLYVEKTMPSGTVKQLKTLQKLLGEYQDFDVHQTALIGLQRRLQAQDLLSKQTRQAIAALQADLRQRAARLRARFPEDFSAFCALRVARSLRKAGR